MKTTLLRNVWILLLFLSPVCITAQNTITGVIEPLNSALHMDAAERCLKPEKLNLKQALDHYQEAYRLNPLDLTPIKSIESIMVKAETPLLFAQYLRNASENTKIAYMLGQGKLSKEQQSQLQQNDAIISIRLSDLQPDNAEYCRESIEACCAISAHKQVSDGVERYMSILASKENVPVGELTFAVGRGAHAYFMQKRHDYVIEFIEPFADILTEVADRESIRAITHLIMCYHIKGKEESARPYLQWLRKASPADYQSIVSVL